MTLISYIDLLIQADSEGIRILEKPLKAYKGRVNSNRILIKKDMTENEKMCVMAEELGHYYKTVGNILDQNNIWNIKQEKIARKWAVNKLLSPYDLIDACKSGCEYLSDVAEHLNVTVDFLLEALQVFKAKYGPVYRINQYIISFSDAGYHVEICESANA